MFTIRLNSYQFFQYLLIFFVSSEIFAKQTPKKCAEFNEFCLNHWDCCSNSCMSYMYRCTRGAHMYPYPFLGISYKPTVTLDQILEQNFGSSNSIPTYQPETYFANRFDDANNVAATEVQIVLQKSEVATTEATTLEGLVDQLQSTSTAIENHQEAEAVNDRIFQTTQPTIYRSTIKSSCAKVGEKCYRHDECCRKLCHGYLHQCVT